jgi:hypothetical protein
MYNAGAKDEAAASDLIGSGCVPLSELAAMLGTAGGGRAVEVFLYNASNRALSDRLKRQRASIVITLAQSLEENISDAASRGYGLALSQAPVPLSMVGGADPDPAAKPFALAEAETKIEAGSVVPASADVEAAAAAVAAAPEKEVEAAPPAEAPAATPAAAPEAGDAEKNAAGKSSVEASPAASVDLAQQPEQRDALAAEAAALATDNQAESADAGADGDADAAAASSSAAGGSDAQKKKNKKKKKGGK